MAVSDADRSTQFTAAVRPAMDPPTTTIRSVPPNWLTVSVLEQNRLHRAQNGRPFDSVSQLAVNVFEVRDDETIVVHVENLTDHVNAIA
jgi:hypothetical protein